MNGIGDNPEIYFRVSPFLNLYFSLEVATGMIREEYNEEYADQMKKVFPEQILKKFKQSHDRQRFSWKIKSCLFDTISENKLENSMLLVAKKFNDLLNDAFSYYQVYWKKVGPDLMKAREVLEENKKECEGLLATASDLLNIPWRIGELHIQLVDPFTGEPMGKNTVSLGIGSITSIPSADLTAISYFFILHEAMHILVWDSIRTMAEKYTTKEHAEYIDEAIMNLISNSILKREEKFRGKFWKAMELARKLKFPPPSYPEKTKTTEGAIYQAHHEKMNRYLTHYTQLFQNDWEELLAKDEKFSNIIQNLLERNAEKIENRHRL